MHSEAGFRFTVLKVTVLIHNIFCTIEESGVSLLQLIGSPPPEDITQAPGPNRQIAYLFTKDTKTGQMALAHFPTHFYRDFSLVFHLKPTSDDAGVLFSITDSNQNIMYVGVKLSAVEDGKRKVIFYYTEPDSDRSQEVASFEVAHQPQVWSRFSLAVNMDQVSFYEDCDTEPKVVKFDRSPDDLELETNSRIFVGQSGTDDPDKYQVCPVYH